LAAGAAGAATIPVGSVGFDISVQGGEAWDHVYAGTASPSDPNSLAWGDGYWAGTDVHLEWDSVTADLDPFVSGNWAVTNTSGSTQIITLIIDLPVLAVSPSSLMYGSTSISVSDANGDGGSSLATVASNALYYGRIDLGAVGASSLFSSPYSLTTGLLGTASATSSFGVAPGSVPGPAVAGFIGIQHVFALSAGDRATFNSIFSVVVPEPSVILLGLAGLVIAEIARRAH
jgi:hypothetical protein